MSLEKNKVIARRYQEEIWGKGDLALIDELLASNPKFRALIAKSKSGSRKPFSLGD